MPGTEEEFEIERQILDGYAEQLAVVESNKQRNRPTKAEPCSDPQSDPKYRHLQYVFDAIVEEKIIAQEVLANGSNQLKSYPNGYRTVYAILMRSLRVDEERAQNPRPGAGSPKRASFSRSDWRRRFVHWALFRIDEAETLLAQSGDPTTTHALISETRKCLLMAAALAKGHTSIGRWAAHLLAVRDARSAKGTAAHKAVAPYHKKMDDLAVQVWTRKPLALPREVARAIAPRLEAWVDKQKSLTIDVEISDVTRRLKNHQTQLMTVARAAARATSDQKKKMT